jgi:hypothetical protein
MDKINEQALVLIDEYSRIEAIGWGSAVQGDLEDYIERKIIKSPIEQMFFVAWKYGCQDKNDTFLVPQVKVGKFFIDFEADIMGHFVNHEFPFNDKTLFSLSQELPKIAIELDGHDFHEKTKDQVAKDKKRERFIVGQGYTVYRFSGSEVFRRPLDCVSEVRDQARAIIKKFKKKVWGAI